MNEIFYTNKREEVEIAQEIPVQEANEIQDKAVEPSEPEGKTNEQDVDKADEISSLIENVVDAESNLQAEDEESHLDATQMSMPIDEVKEKKAEKKTKKRKLRKKPVVDEDKVSTMKYGDEPLNTEVEEKADAVEQPLERLDEPPKPALPRQIC